MTKNAKIAAADAALTAAIDARYTARDAYMASGTAADLAILRKAIDDQAAASAALALLGR
jgi:hypothetical protein